MELDWIAIGDKEPDIEQRVLAHIEYLTNGKPMWDIVAGYQDEYGELIYCGSDECSGWRFNDVVTHWMPLPNPLKQTS